VLGISKSEERDAVRRLALLVVLVAMLGLASCHGTPAASTAVSCTATTSTTSTSTTTSTCTDPTTGISVTIAPATVSVSVVATTLFTASVQGGTNNVVTWQVNSIQGGNDTVGRIDSNGLYHAPGTVPSPSSVTVAAVSYEDPKVSASSTVTITPAPVVTITSPTTPITVTSGVKNTVTFTASVTGGTLNTVFWEVGPVGGPGGVGNATLGTINANGVYSAPATPPIGSTVVITAVSQDSSSSTASVPLTISGYSTSSLNGQFAFSVSGTNASGPFVRAGSFVADGAGNLNSGSEDINDASGVTSVPISFVGTYTVTADGRGTLQFNDGRTPAIFNFVLVNVSQLQIIGFDSTGTASGQANAQLASTFNTSPLRGTYVFDFNGTHNSNGISEIGEFAADGAGNITGGSIDVNDNGTISQLQITGNTAAAGQTPVYPSTYSTSINSNGRGTLTLATSGATLHFSFYIVSAGSAKFVGTDSQTATGAVAGSTALQAVNVAFNQTSLSGNYAFLLEGSGSGGTYASAGSFLADGQGNVSNGALDENVSGTPNPNVVLSGTAYTVASSGRGTLQLTGGRTYVFYLGPTGTAVFQETDANHPNIVSDGTFSLQQSGSFALSQVVGNYAVYTTGPPGAFAEGVTGQLAANGTGGVSSGIVDLNTAGSATAGVGITTGTYSVSSSAERGTLSLNLASPLSQTRNYAVYVVSSTQAFVVGIDSGRDSSGALLRQF